MHIAQRWQAPDAPKIVAERAAFVGLLDLMRQAEHVAAMFERAGMPLPPPLVRLFSEANDA